MKPYSLPALVRTTTFRLALLNSVLFTVFMVGLLAYIYSTTFGFVRSEADSRVNTELSELTNAYRSGGRNRLEAAVLERRSVPGLDRFFYVLTDPDGRQLQGDFNAIPVEVTPETPERIEFSYDVPLKDGSLRTRSAEGRLEILDDGTTLFVAYDVADNIEIFPLLQRALGISLPIGLLMSLVAGVLISRTAARRADELTKTTEAVMAGDLTRRSPIVGSGDEFDRLAERQNAMLDRIEKLINSSRQVGDAIAHDLRSPLTRLRNRLEGGLALDPDQPPSEVVLQESLNEVDRLLGTFNAILRLSRLEAGESGKLDRMDLSELVHELADLYQPACEDAGQTFFFAVDPKIEVLGDRGLIAQAIANLLDNAMKYTPAGGTISLEARRSRTAAMADLIVTDSGPGIPEEDRTRVTERFVRLEKSRSEPGSGLGLSLVEAVADLHKGQLMLGDGKGPKDAPGLRAVLCLPRL